MRLLAIAGSLRTVSTNRRLLVELARVASAGMTIKLYDGMGDLPIFNPDREGDLTPASVLDLASQVKASDGLVLSVPEYAHGIPGGFKNLIDWLVSRDELADKPVLLVHASHRGDFMLDALTEVLRTVSVAMPEGPMLRIPLLGKKPHEQDAVLSDPVNRAAMVAALSGFAGFIESRALVQVD